jgi:hypothetical protein
VYDSVPSGVAFLVSRFWLSTVYVVTPLAPAIVQRKVYNYHEGTFMNRIASSSAVVLAAVAALLGQDRPTPQHFPPDIGPATIAITGVGGKTAEITAGDLFKLPQKTVKTTDNGTAVSFEGVLLADALAKVDLPLGEKFHSTAASYYLVVQAKDGYRAVFAWAELDPGFMDKAIYLVMKRDGKPLSEKDGPFQVVVPGEKRGGRWVRHVTALQIRQTN